MAVHDAVAVQWPAPREGYRMAHGRRHLAADGRPGPRAWPASHGALGARSVTVLTEERDPPRVAPASAGVEPELLAALAAAAGIAPTGTMSPAAAMSSRRRRRTRCWRRWGSAPPRPAKRATGWPRWRPIANADVCRPCAWCRKAPPAPWPLPTDIGARRTAAPLRLTREDGTETLLPFAAGDGPAMALQRRTAAARTRRCSRCHRCPPATTR